MWYDMDDTSYDICLWLFAWTAPEDRVRKLVWRSWSHWMWAMAFWSQPRQKLGNFSCSKKVESLQCVYKPGCPQLSSSILSLEYPRIHAWLHGPCLFRCPENGGHVAEVWPAKWWEDSGADQELDPWQAKLQGRDGLLWHWVVCWLMWFLFWKFWQGMWETSHKSALFCIHFMSTVCIHSSLF